MAKRAGDVLAGRYRLVEHLGRGGMGEVWKAEHLTLKAHVAVKLLNPELVSTEGATRRFEREARAAAALRSPHVVQITDHGVDDGVPFIAMELLDGETLSDRIRRQRQLTPVETLRVVTHVGRALAKAHELGIVHRDVKPENIFIVRNDDEEICKLLDYGVVKVMADVEAAAKTQSGALVGTPLYMSPEQLRARPLDHRADLWSLALVAYECMCGRVPFGADSLADLIVQITREDILPPSRVAEVPAGFDAWFERATRRDPSERFQSAKAMVEALRPLLESAPNVVSKRSADVPPGIAEAPTLAASVITGRTAAPPRRVLTLTAVGAIALISAGAWWLGRTAARPAGTNAVVPPTAAALPSVGMPRLSPSTSASDIAPPPLTASVHSSARASVSAKRAAPIPPAPSAAASAASSAVANPLAF